MKDNLVTLSEMSKITGIDSRRLRYWDTAGKLVPVHRTDKGFRYYSQEQVVKALELDNRRVIVAYTMNFKIVVNDKDYYIELTKRENESFMKEVQTIEKDAVIIGVYDWDWRGTVIGSELEKVIKQAAKGLVSKIYYFNKDFFIRGEWTSYQRWLGYMNTELIDIRDVEENGHE